MHYICHSASSDHPESFSVSSCPTLCYVRFLRQECTYLLLSNTILICTFFIAKFAVNNGMKITRNVQVGKQGFFFEPNCQTAKLRARNVKRKSEIKGLTCLIKTYIANAIVFIQNNNFIIQTN